jgi:hypothetical protein
MKKGANNQICCFSSNRLNIILVLIKLKMKKMNEILIFLENLSFIH